MRLFTYMLLYTCLFCIKQAGATVYRIEAGENQISAIVPNLVAGDTLHLVTPAGVYHETDDIDLPAIPLTIIGHTNTPTWTVSASRQVEVYDALNLQNIIFDGRNSTASALRIHTPPPKAIHIDNCTFHSFLQDAITEQQTKIGTLIVRNSLFYDIAQTALEFKTVDSCKELIVENCTFYHIGEKAIHLVSMTLQTNVILKNLTINNCVGGIWLEGAGSGEVTNCIVTKCWSYGIRVIPATSPVNITYTCTYDNKRPYGETPPGIGCIEAAPLHLDAKMGDFSLRSPSPCLTASQNNTPIGDLRWVGNATVSADQKYKIKTFGPPVLGIFLFLLTSFGIYRIASWRLHERAYRRGLERSRTRLEARVLERTQELKRANEILETEISQRRQIEQTLRDTYNTLEKKMDERTQELETTRDDLQVRNEQLQQAQKLEAIGQLAGGIAHDFNNNLAIIRGYVDMALEQVASNAQLHRYLSQVNEAVQRSARLTGQLLIFSSKQPVEPQTININENILALEDMFRRLLGEDIVVELNLEENIWAVMADSGNIDQIITNLAVNARDAMPTGGTLKISTHNTNLQTPTHPDAHSGRYVCLRVSDTGIGMSEEVQSHLFEPFYTTKEKGSGTGLGLAIIYGLVQAHHGWINVTSEQGKGSTFDIYLPMEDTLIQDVSEKAEQAPLGQKERILLIEDEPSLRVMKQSILENHNYQVISSASCGEARETFATHKGQFDLIFSDIVLPDGRGTDLVSQFSRENPDIAIILATGYTDDRADWDKARQAGWPVLQKPVSVKNLLAEIHKALTSKNT